MSEYPNQGIALKIESTFHAMGNTSVKGDNKYDPVPTVNMPIAQLDGEEATTTIPHMPLSVPERDATSYTPSKRTKVSETGGDEKSQISTSLTSTQPVIILQKQKEPASPAVCAVPNASSSHTGSASFPGRSPIVTTKQATNLSSSSNNQLLLPDYTIVRQTVRDILSLLQTYGPLTAGQIQYNIPPVHHSDTDPNKWEISEVLELLVALGLVQKVLHSYGSNSKGSDNPSSPILQQYCVCSGIPRANVVLPADIPDDITAAHRQAARSWQRSRVLQKAIKSNWSTKTVLEQLVKEFPEITNDPVYRASLRNCHVDPVQPAGTASITVKAKKTGGSKTSAATTKSNSGKVTISPKNVSKKYSSTTTEVTSSMNATAAATNNEACNAAVAKKTANTNFSESNQSSSLETEGKTTISLAEKSLNPNSSSKSEVLS